MTAPSRFDERLEWAVSVLYETRAARGDTWTRGTRWNALFLQAVLTAKGPLHAQLLQDAFVLAATEGKRDGVFVEIGVGDGVHLSNTLALERDYGWRGLLIEANPHFWPSIESSRSLSRLAKVAVLAEPAGKLTFRHVPGFPEISSLDVYAGGDGHDRSIFESIEVESAGVASVFKTNDIPRDVDYVSIDVEGPDVEILAGILKADYRPRVITIEHNRLPERLAQIETLLKADYEIVLRGASGWDLWAVEKSFAAMRLDTP